MVELGYLFVFIVVTGQLWELVYLRLFNVSLNKVKVARACTALSFYNLFGLMNLFN